MFLQSLDYEVMDNELHVKEQKEKSGNVRCLSFQNAIVCVSLLLTQKIVTLTM